MTRILISGADGYLAKRLTALLADHELHGMDLARGDDVADAASWERFRDVQPEIVFHLAGVRPVQAEAQPALAARVNVLGTATAMEFAASFDHRPVFVFASSYVATGQGIYGITKLCGEQLGARFHQRGSVDFRAVRLGSVISSDKPAGLSDFYRRIATERSPVTVPVSAELSLPVIFADDAVAALAALAFADPDSLSQRVYDVFGPFISAGAFADLVSQHRPGLAVRYEPDERVEGTVGGVSLALDRGAAARDFGWQPEYGPEELARKLVGG
jgi:nucleoside-diphosphate-sugar epimerase